MITLMFVLNFLFRLAMQLLLIKILYEIDKSLVKYRKINGGK